MQTIYLDVSKKETIPTIVAKQGDVGRKFVAIVTDTGASVPDVDTLSFSVWYSGASGNGNYSHIDGRPAVVVGERNKSKVTVELIAQMLSNAGCGNITLVMNSRDGKQIGTWNIPYCVDAIAGFGSQPAEDVYGLFSQAIVAAETATAAAKSVADSVSNIVDVVIEELPKWEGGNY